MTKTRQEAAANINGCVDKIEIDFADLSNLSKQICCSFLGLSLVSVQVRTVGCTGISGNWVIKQSPDDSGSDATDLPEGALTITGAVTAVGVVAKATLTMEYLVITIPTTLPTTGKAILSVTAKIQ